MMFFLSRHPRLQAFVFVLALGCVSYATVFFSSPPEERAWAGQWHVIAVMTLAFLAVVAIAYGVLSIIGRLLPPRQKRQPPGFEVLPPPSRASASTEEKH